MQRAEIKQWVEKVHDEAEEIAAGTGDYQLIQWIRQIKKLAAEIKGFIERTD